MIAEQALIRLKALHNNGLIHRDIKPENFAPGLGNDAETIYLFDFGLVKEYIEGESRRHIPYKEGIELTGTLRYSSVNAHLGIEQSRRDDLESLGYALIYMAKGSLPWQGIANICQGESYQHVLTKMLNTSMQSLCDDLPCIIINIL